MCRAGLDVARLNFSATTTMQAPEAAARGLPPRGSPVGILGDLAGPKIRIESFRDGPVQLVDGRVHARHRLARRRRPARSTRSAVPTRTCRRTSARRHPAAERRPDRARGHGHRRHAHRHPRARRRRAVEQQGRQPQGRRHLGARADRQGPRGHRVRGGEGSTTSRSRSCATAADVERGARAAARRPAGTRRSSPRSSAHEAIRTSRTSSMPATWSWSPAATSAWRSATPS
jgi:hypothetical protein